MIRLITLLCLGLGLILNATLVSANATSMVLPLKLDYALIRSLFVQQAFTEPGESVVVIDEPDSCQFLKLARPEIYPEAGALRLKSFVSLKTGLPVLNTCQILVDLEGMVDVRLHVQFDKTGWVLTFQPEDLRLTSADGQSPLLAGQLPTLIQERIFAHLDQVQVDLATPIQGLREILPNFFADRERAGIIQWLNSIRPGRIEARPEWYSVELIMDVAAQGAGGRQQAGERRLSAAEMQRFIRGWETWDAFLVQQIDYLGHFGLEAQDRALILQTLLESRYQMANALSSDQTAPSQDLVRMQFVHTWGRFAPMIRKYLSREPSTAPFSALAYLSAGDALAALDKIGPTVGLEISRDGLIRLARLLTGEEGPMDLDYSFEVDPGLRKMLGFGPPLKAPDRLFPDEELELDLPVSEGGEIKGQTFLSPATWHWLSPSAAYAAERPPIDREGLKKWLVERANFEAYLTRMRALFQEESKQIMATGKLAADRGDLFTKILQATAWQESCFRQFTVKGGKMTYLRSWNNTSVGLMQINERVWRGLYRLDALRWDPGYNIQAGSEILRMYLSEFVLKQGAPPLPEEGLAQATYALYNSGPQNFKKFMGRYAKGDYLTSDKLFRDKYAWTKAGEFDRLKVCLFGD